MSAFLWVTMFCSTSLLNALFCHESIRRNEHPMAFVHAVAFAVSVIGMALTLKVWPL